MKKSARIEARFYAALAVINEKVLFRNKVKVIFIVGRIITLFEKSHIPDTLLVHNFVTCNI